MDTIKPCPFCGYEDCKVISEELMSDCSFNKDLPNNGHGYFFKKLYYYVQCHCSKQRKRYASEQEAIEAWNKRI